VGVGVYVTPILCLIREPVHGHPACIAWPMQGCLEDLFSIASLIAHMSTRARARPLALDACRYLVGHL